MLLVEGTSSAFVWPRNDVYFHYGISRLCNQKDINIDFRGYLFINLNGNNLKKFMREISYFGSSKLIIFSTPTLMPLALFWLRESDRVLAVFDIFSSINNIQIGLISHITNKKRVTGDLDSSKYLSHREVILLNLYIEGVKNHNIQKYLNCGYKTLNSRKLALTKKFRVRKLERLVLNN